MVREALEKEGETVAKTATTRVRAGRAPGKKAAKKR